MSVADFFDLRASLKKMIDDELGTIRQQIDIINTLINDLDLRVNLNRQEITNLRNDFNAFQTTTNNSITNLTTRVTTLENKENLDRTDINNLLSRMTNVELGMNNFNVRLTNIENQLSSFLNKAQPLPGYNPYNLGGNITAQVWMYDITPVNDGDIRMYYLQFNYITGDVGNTTNWMPLPRAFTKYLYAIHSDFSVSSGTFSIPNLWGAVGSTYRVEYKDTKDAILLRYYAGVPHITGDFVGCILIGNGAPSNMSDEDIEKMKHEDLVKLTKELTFKVKQLDKQQEVVDRNKIMKDITEQMKRATEYEFIDIYPPQPKNTKK